MKGLPLDQRLAILAEYDAGGVSHAELAAKHGIGESTISTWRRRLPSVERKCTVCGSGVPFKAIAWRGSLLCGTCGKAKRAAAHLIYYHAHKEKIDTAPRKSNLLSEAKHRDHLAEQHCRNQEVLARLLQRMIGRFGEWEDDYSVVNREQLSNPSFIVVDKGGVKHKENLMSPLPGWDEKREDLNAGAANNLRLRDESQLLSTMHLAGELVPCNECATSGRS